MILKQLYDDAPAILGEQMPPAMYDVKPVRCVIPLTPEGQLSGDTFLLLGGDKENKRGIPMSIPYVGRTSGVKAVLLADKPAYVLGVAFSKGVAVENPLIEQTHSAFKELVHRCAVETNDPLVAAVDTFLAGWQPDAERVLQLTSGAGLDVSDLIVFLVGDKGWPHEVAAVQQFWARVARPQAASENAARSQCLVTGNEIEGAVDTSLPGMVKGLPGGQTSGTALISANSVAFESHGLKGTQVSPISREAAERFTKALNRLIAGEHTHYTVGDLVYVFWTPKGPDEEIISYIRQPNPEKVQALFDSYRTGRRVHSLDTSQFFGIGLSANGGRAVVRDWITTTLDTAYANLTEWFAIQRIIGSNGQIADPLSVYRLAASLYRDARKEMNKSVPRLLVRAALNGEALPVSLRDQAVMRNRAEQRVTRNRAALIKAVFVMQEHDRDKREERAREMTSLNTAETHPAYLCGRLLAQLERIQRNALGKTNTTLTDRYFGAASTRPATVFGQLLADANKAHLPKIRKQNEKTYNALQNRLAEILNPLNGEFPPPLTLADQARFALGYYFQRSQNLADALAAKERAVDASEIDEEIETEEE